MQSQRLFIKTEDDSTISEYETGLNILSRVISEVKYIWESQPEQDFTTWKIEAEFGLSDFDDYMFDVYEELGSQNFHSEKLDYLREFLTSLAKDRQITVEQFHKWNLQFDDFGKSLQDCVSQMSEFYLDIAQNDEIEIGDEKRIVCKRVGTWLNKFHKAIAPRSYCGWIGFEFDDFYMG